MSIVQIVTLDITHLNILKVTKYIKRQLGQLYWKLLLQLQKMKNFSVLPTKLQYVKLWLGHFTNQAQGDRRNGISPRN